MKKNLDCVEMKNRLQADLREQEQQLGAEETRRRRQMWLKTGEDGLARWWQSLSARTQAGQEPLVLREDPAVYRTKEGYKP